MAAIDFVIRTSAGALRQGKVLGGDSDFSLVVGTGQEISLNVHRSAIRSYSRIEDDLLVTLSDGRVVVLENYFVEAGTLGNQLYVSAGNEISEVDFTAGKDGALNAIYTDIPNPGKWGPLDPLVFIDDPVVAAPTQYAGAAGEDVSMLAAAVGLAGGSGLAAAGLAAAGVLGAAVIGGGDSGGGSSSSGGGGENTTSSKVPPTVNDPEAVTKMNEASEKTLTITGTGEPGAEVEVTLGGKTQTTTVNEDGTWSTTFEGNNFPADGTYESVVKVTDPDGATHTLDGPGYQIDTATEIDIVGPVEQNDVVNAVEASDGVTIAGKSEPGAEVEITLGGVTKKTTVNEDGSWSVTYAAGEIDQGTYETTVTATVTDAFGNTASDTHKIAIDTENFVTVKTSDVETDGVVNAVEAADGIVLTGTSEPGASVNLSFNGNTYNTIATAQGNWSVNVPASGVPSGEREVDVTATTTDAAGNVATDTKKLTIDTENSVTVNTNAVEGDGVINAAEKLDGVVLTGATQPGSTVIVEFNGQSQSASVDANGNWSASFPASAIPDGETNVAVKATSTDAAGNVSAANGTVEVDTYVNALSITNNTVAGDNVANAEEVAAGIDVTGTVEPGSAVVLTFNNQSYNATVDANGNWSAVIPSDAVQPGEYTTSFSVTATDAAGNQKTISHDFEVDTVVPDPAKLTAVTMDSDDDAYRQLFTEYDADTQVAVHTIDNNGNVLQAGGTPSRVGNENLFSFEPNLPDGSNLIVSSSDASGNGFGSYVVLNKAGNVDVQIDAAKLAQYEIAAIDLDFASNAKLSLTEAQVKQLSSLTDEVKIYGGSDDQVTISGATRTGTKTEDGQTFNGYQLGADGEVWIEDDVNVVI